jgi:penicillin amidase
VNLGRARRALAALGIAGLLVAGAIVTVAYQYVRRSVQAPGGRETLARLDRPLTVHFDSFGIPHLFGDSEEDVLRAQGYLHASDRLWQMEVFQRIARGRLSEAFGEAALDTDRFIRTLDLWAAAGETLAALRPAERRLLQAYAEGVNERIRTWSGPWPPEFLVLGLEPQPWEPQASVAVAKIMALDLSGWKSELSRFVAWSLLDPERYRYLELPYPEWGPTIVEGATGAASEDAVSIDPPSEPEPDSFVERSLAVAPAGAPGDGGWDPLAFLSGFAFSASNAWAVAGHRTRDGYALLASDMHLPLRAPATWYINALHAAATDLHVAGLSIPGAPGVIVGYNRHVAWGFTNAMADDMDFVVEAINLDDSAYREEGVWRPFDERVDTIRVRGREEPVLHRVRRTIRGPVISDVLPGVGSTLSLLWTVYWPTTEVSGLLAMNRATGAAEFEAGVRLFGSPHQNVIYVTVDGTLGYRLSGTVPRRDGWNGARPIPHTRVAGGWIGRWPADSFPVARNPESGFLASANNLQRPDLFGVVGIDYPVPFRARRIVDRLSKGAAWTLDSMRALQLDTHSLLGERFVKRAIAAAERIGESSAAAALAAWDLRASLESTEATLFHVWLYRLRALIAADEFRNNMEWAFFPPRALLEVLEDGESPWVDDVRTDEVETLAALEEEAMREAIHWADRPWGEVHRERSTHLLGGVGWLDRVLGLNVGPRPGPGGPHTVRPDDPRRWSPLDSTSWKPPYLSEYGPSERFVVEMRPGASRGYLLLPTGQSGNPLSPNYRDMAERWNRGALVAVPLDEDQARALSARTLQFEPRQ